MDEESGDVVKPELVMVNSWSDKVNISELCRICANTSDTLISIFEGEGVEHDLPLKINKHLPVKVTQEDKLPKNVCYPCASTLIAWHDMNVSCIEAEKKLQSILNDIYISSISDDEFCDDNQSMDLDVHNDIDVQENISDEKILSQTEEVKIVDVSSIKKIGSTSPRHNVSKNVSESCIIEEETQKELEESALATCEPEVKPENSIVSADPLSANDVEKTKTCLASTSTNNSVQVTTDKPSGKSKKAASQSLKAHKKIQKKSNKLKSKTMRAGRKSDDGSSVKIHQCDKCPWRFQHRYKLVNHMKIHSEKKDFICHICAKSFHWSKALKHHIERMHLKLKNHICDFCNQGFADKTTLIDHRRRHTGEKPYICDVCGKAFRSASSIGSHRKSHKDEFPYPCNICGHKFRFRQNLRDHVTKHTNEKKYTCDVCGQAFRQVSSLRRHKIVHSEDKPYSCSICCVSFKMNRYLKYHIKTKHIM